MRLKFEGRLKESEISKSFQATEDGIKIKRCRIPMQRFSVAKNNVVDFVEVVDNVWETMIALQNKGYAYIVP